ncbi:hypothetical protein KFE25_011758 [Diacronema lutheri]|uniref:Uncharacterized protein n=1 Tax=Diacronema lutheri TaxID=2081491 RepID=A0A8J6C2Y3_DIALT|nr:hypothetical protein KFE25_011758 [Diacronema lutheri]
MPGGWARGTGQGIGLSGHINAYSAEATLIANWTEEAYGRQLDALPPAGHVTAHATESQKYTGHDTASKLPASPPMLGRTAEQLFAHGLPDEPKLYVGSCTELAFTDPRTRLHGATSVDRVSRTLWAGSKHIDKTVPHGSAVPRTALLDAKRAEWARTAPAVQPSTIGLGGTTSSELGAAQHDEGSLLAVQQLPPAGGMADGGMADGAPPAAISFGRRSAFTQVRGTSQVLRA